MHEGTGLLHVKIKSVEPMGGKKYSTSKLLVRVADQGYMNIMDLSGGGIEMDEVKMFECKTSDSLQLQFSDDKSGYQAQLRFSLKKLAQMPRVKHVVEAVLMKKVDKDMRNNPKLKIQNMLQVDLEIIYLNNIQGKFIIETMQVELTRDTEIVGQMDPYIIAKLGDKKHITKAKNNQGKHCIWTQRFQMQVTQSGQSNLSLKVYDKDPIKDDLVCSTQLLLLKQGLLIPSEKPKQRQFSLFYQKKVAGTIKLEYKFEMLPFNY